MSRTCRWVFTVNNPGAWRPVFHQEMAYLVWERETAPTTGTEHIQGYLRLARRLRFNQVMALLHQTAHIEPARGSEEQNREYCSKDRQGNDWGEHGDFQPKQRQGRRTDLEQVVRAVTEGLPLPEIAAAHPTEWVKYHAGLLSLRRYLTMNAPISRTVTTMILWGPTGVGKTHRVRTAYPNAFVVRPGRDPFGTYSTQTELIFEEFEPEKWTLQQMNCYLDKWATELDCRYFSKQAMWTRVFILSNLNPASWYTQYPEELQAAFRRRITYTVEIKDRNQELLLLS